MSNVIIIGSGPAGISAALYTARAGVETLVIGGGAGALAKADKIENYYGFAEPVAAKDLLAAGIAQAKHAGAEVLEDEVVGIGFGTKLTVSTQSREYEADYVVLATGASRSTPPIPGLRELEGHGVSYCAVCDAFFYRGKDVAVLGSGEYAMHEAAELLPVVGSVTVLTGGAPLTGVLPEGAKLDTRKLSAFAGDGVVERAEFGTGRACPSPGSSSPSGWRAAPTLPKSSAPPPRAPASWWTRRWPPMCRGSTPPGTAPGACSRSPRRSTRGPRRAPASSPRSGRKSKPTAGAAASAVFLPL